MLATVMMHRPLLACAACKCSIQHMHMRAGAGLLNGLRARALSASALDIDANASRSGRLPRSCCSNSHTPAVGAPPAAFLSCIGAGRGRLRCCYLAWLPAARRHGC